MPRDPQESLYSYFERIGVVEDSPGKYSATFAAQTFLEGPEVIPCGGEDQHAWFRKNWAKFMGQVK